MHSTVYFIHNKKEEKVQRSDCSVKWFLQIASFIKFPGNKFYTLEFPKDFFWWDFVEIKIVTHALTESWGWILEMLVPVFSL